MAIRFAFSTLACPDWSVEQVVEQAKEMGYDGVELRTLGAGGTKLASDPATTDPAKVKAAFEGSGVEPMCLSTSTAFDARDPGQGKAVYFEALKHLELAQEIGCKQVRFFGLKIKPGENRLGVIQRIASRIPEVAEKAMSMGIEVLFENAGSFNAAKEWWWLLNLVNHPNVGMCWNMANAASVDTYERGGGMAVTMLNSKIKLVKVKDTTFGEGSGFCQLGDGDVGVERCLAKLRGVGFDGYITTEWDKAWLPTLAPADEYLPEALSRMKAWMTAIDEWVEKGRKTAEKAAKKIAPKPRAEVAAK
jgi:sugar phosphate isomerase/epimerase